MIRWCSYCQTFMGSIAPFKDFRLSHGICDTCRPKVLTEDDFAKKAQRFAEVFQETWDRAVSCRIEDIGELFAKLQPLGLSNSDFLFAIVARQLEQVGCLFANNEFTVMAEHRFTNFVEGALSYIHLNRLRSPSERDSFDTEASRPDVMLACADGNYHAIGIRILEEALNDSGLSCVAVFPSLPIQELLGALDRYRPKVLGVSFSDNNQFVQLEALRNFISYKGSVEGADIPQLICGGGVWEAAPAHIKSLADLPWDSRDFKKSIEMLRSAIRDRSPIIQKAS